METKRLILAVALSAIVLFAWQAFFLPPPPRQQPPAAEETVSGEPAPVVPTDVPPGAPPPAPDDTWATAEGTAEERVALGNDLFRVELTNRGGLVRSWRLREYTTVAGDELELVPRFDGSPPALPLSVHLEDPELARRVNEALYQVERERDGAGERVRFHWADGRGLEVDKTLTVRDGDYRVHVAVSVRDRGRRLATRVAWGPGFGAQDPGAGRSTYYYSDQVAWNRGGSVSRDRSHKVDPQRWAGRIRWAGLEDQYFAALWLPGERAELEITVDERARVLTGAAAEEAEEPPEPEEIASVAVSVPESGVQLFVGPKKYTMLRELGSDLEKAVWFATNGFLAAISKFVFLSLLWIHDHTIPNYGMAILLTTLVLRLILFPLNQYSMVSIKRSQVQMQRLQPKISAIKNRHKKKDAETRGRMNQEIMALYKSEGVNPMGGLTGCLPLLAQFPILIGFYNMLTVAIELRGAPFFGWIQDLSQKDPYLVTPLLMGVTMFLQQRMSMTKITDPAQRQQQRIMMFMPFFFTYVCIKMPSGLVLYWFANNVLGIGQQWLVNRRTGRLEAAATKA